MAKKTTTRLSKRQNKVVTSEEVEEVDNVKTDPQMDIVVGSASTVSVTCEKKEEGESNGANQLKKTQSKAGSERKMAVKGKRNASSSVESSPPKKTKLNNDKYCVFVDNLNNHKTFDEVKDSLAKCFINQSILFQDIRLDKFKKHAFVDLASNMDLTKCLALDGEVLHDMPISISLAETQGAAKAHPRRKRAKDENCLFVKNVPYNTTKEELLKVFNLAGDVRFPGGVERPTHGIAFVEFENETVAQSVLQQKQGVVIKDRILVMCSADKANLKQEDKKAEVGPNNTLFVTSLPYNIKENRLKEIFNTAVAVSLPSGKTRGFAFVEFASVEEAEKVMKATQKMKIGKKPIRVQFCNAKQKERHGNVLMKTLVVMGLADKTTAETLKMAFEGALSARIPVVRKIGTARRYGFVEFESEETCRAVKKAMEDCEIDGRKVTVANAMGNRFKVSPTPGGQPAGPGTGSGGQDGER